MFPHSLLIFFSQKQFFHRQPNQCQRLFNLYLIGQFKLLKILHCGDFKLKYCKLKFNCKQDGENFFGKAVELDHEWFCAVSSLSFTIAPWSILNYYFSRTWLLSIVKDCKEFFSNYERLFTLNLHSLALTYLSTLQYKDRGSAIYYHNST